MLDTTAIYQKTATGSQALAERNPALTPRLRSLLILVDGKRSCPELLQVAQALGDGEQLLAQLLALGFMEARAQVPAPAAAEPAAAAAAPVSSLSLPQAQRLAVRKLTDLLGPTADDVCLRIEATRTPQEFAAAVERAEEMLRRVAGPRKAAEFAAALAEHRPGS